MGGFLFCERQLLNGTGIHLKLLCTNTSQDKKNQTASKLRATHNSQYVLTLTQFAYCLNPGYYAQ